MNTKHTPGPWKWLCEPGEVGKLNSASGFVIDSASHENMWFSRYNAEDAANARLIASAPELLEALQEIVGCVFADLLELQGDDPLIDQARAAIAKATGSAP